MKYKVFCKKLKKEAEGLDARPFPGELGDEIYQKISKEAWGLWLNHQTMLINEYRLTMIDPKARVFLQDEMKKFLFEGGDAKPPGYVDPAEKPVE